MAYKDKEKQREYQKRWISERRNRLLDNKTCRDCGEKSNLRIADAKRSGKKFSTSYSVSKLAEKINGATILCESCYNKYNTERLTKRATKHGHSKGNSRTYCTWRSMLDRCYNTSKDNYKWYGGKGVEVCDRWHEFENFLTDMGERPLQQTLDRIDPRGNYEPGNCRWADSVTQGKNKRRNLE